MATPTLGPTPPISPGPLPVPAPIPPAPSPPPPTTAPSVVKGRITWPDGRPGTAVPVQVVDQDLRGQEVLSPPPPALTQTDSDGRYVVHSRAVQSGGEDQRGP